MRIMSNPIQTCRRFDEEDEGLSGPEEEEGAEGEELIVEPSRNGAVQHRGALQERDTNVAVSGDRRMRRVKS